MFAFLPLGVEELGDRKPWGTVGLVLGMVALHALLPEGAVDALIQHNDRFRPWTWVTAALLHADWGHLLGNMIFLLTVGIVVEGIAGTRRFLALYAAIAVVAGIAEQVLFWGDPTASLGASGVIYGFMAIGLLWAPRAKVRFGFVTLLGGPRLGTANVEMFWAALWWLGWDLFSLLFFGFRLSTPLLHMLGAAAGVAAGLLCLDRAWVDTRGQDLFSIRERERDDAPDKLKHVLVKRPTMPELVESLIDHAIPAFAGILVALGVGLLAFYVPEDPDRVVGRLSFAALLIAAGAWMFRYWKNR